MCAIRVIRLLHYVKYPLSVHGLCIFFPPIHRDAIVTRCSPCSFRPRYPSLDLSPSLVAGPAGARHGAEQNQQGNGPSLTHQLLGSHLSNYESIFKQDGAPSVLDQSHAIDGSRPWHTNLRSPTGTGTSAFNLQVPAPANSPPGHHEGHRPCVGDLRPLGTASAHPGHCTSLALELDVSPDLSSV